MTLGFPFREVLVKKRWTGWNIRTRGEVIQLGLKRILQLFDPSKINFNAIHVAGTNGKGTVCFYTAHILHSRGLQVGRFTSPHLIDRWDCININGNPVSEGLFKNIEAVYRHKNDVEGIGASPFEILTATAFDIFNMHNVDFAVIEVGVGGTEDATNILPQEKVACSVITQIGLDHQALLGSSLAEIASHKAGIIRQGVPCIYDSTSPDEVKDVIRYRASNPRPTPINWRPRQTRGIFSLAPITNQHSPGAGSRENVHWTEHDYAAENLFSVGVEHVIRTRLASDGWIGPYGDGYIPQDFAKPIAMAATAARLSLLRTRGPSVNMASLVALVKGRQFPGRLQSLSIKPLNGRRNPVLLDGAHNIDSAKRLAAFVSARFEMSNEITRSREAVTWLLAASAGKDTVGMLREMLRPHDTVITTSFGAVDGMPWVTPTDAQQLLHEAQSIVPMLNPASCAVGSIREALLQASAIAQEGPLVIAGSLYLVSDVLRLVRSTGGEPEAWWAEWEKPVRLDKSLWTPVMAGERIKQDDAKHQATRDPQEEILSTDT